MPQRHFDYHMRDGSAPLPYKLFEGVTAESLKTTIDALAASDIIPSIPETLNLSDADKIALAALGQDAVRAVIETHQSAQALLGSQES